MPLLLQRLRRVTCVELNQCVGCAADRHRVDGVDFHTGGYRAQATMGAAMLEPLTFRGLPLSALRQPDVRRRARPRRKL